MHVSPTYNMFPWGWSCSGINDETHSVQPTGLGSSSGFRGGLPSVVPRPAPPSGWGPLSGVTVVQISLHGTQAGESPFQSTGTPVSRDLPVFGLGPAPSSVSCRCPVTPVCQWRHRDMAGCLVQGHAGANCPQACGSSSPPHSDSF